MNNTSCCRSSCIGHLEILADGHFAFERFQELFLPLLGRVAIRAGFGNGSVHDDRGAQAPATQARGIQRTFRLLRQTGPIQPLREERLARRPAAATKSAACTVLVVFFSKKSLISA